MTIDRFYGMRNLLDAAFDVLEERGEAGLAEWWAGLDGDQRAALTAQVDQVVAHLREVGDLLNGAGR